MCSDEQARQKREDQDRRLKDGLTRRRQLREQLEEGKRLKVLRREEEQRMKILLEEEDRKMRLLMEDQERVEREEAEREKRRGIELQDMATEESQTRDHIVALREIQHMQHEDIFSFLLEQAYLRRALEREEHVRELEDVYAPFAPFQFRRRRMRLPALHSVLGGVNG
ncbi:hypothetical protein EON64_00575, partial [archaeon]